MNLQTTGAITSAASLTLDGVTDSITASTGALSFGDENLVTTGTTTTAALAISGLDCSGNANGGALTASSTGAISCSDDDFSPIVADSLDFDDFADALTADATTTIDLDTNGADLDFDAGTLFVDSSADRVGLGTTSPVVAFDVVGDIAATGTITTNTGIDLGTGNLFQSPGDPVSIGSVAIGTGPLSIFVSGRYAYVTDVAVDDLKVIDVSDPSAPTEVGKILLGGFPRSVFVSGRYAYVIDSGRCEAYRTLDGRRVSLRTMGPGEVFGEMALLNAEPRTASVVALEPVVVREVHPDLLEQEVGALKPWMRAMVRTVAERFRSLDKKSIPPADGG
ncbi:MAG: cyclic nucleotide-binding domain-containing protein, partial [Thermoanaerobaculia bacterium]|nr:cyclic nucleotide-binding domain-containing protein [Thermoanaerobaculia bacterium]